ncbi:MAG TPA: guanylate kinase [Bacillota bacterium]|jgi:guanylate kinase
MKDFRVGQKGLLLVVSGPSGAGKSRLVEALRRLIPDLQFSVSVTTRPPRAGEQDGVDYHFIKEQDFVDRVARDEFLEWASVYGHHYGSLKSQVMEALRQGKGIVCDIDTRGARQIVDRCPDAVTVFILPPSPEELRRRLESRGTDSRETIEGRLAAAAREILAAGWYQYLVLNDDFKRALRTLEAIVIAERSRLSRSPDELRSFLKQGGFQGPDDPTVS